MDIAFTEWMTEHWPYIQMVILPTVVYCGLQLLGQRYLSKYHHLFHKLCDSLPNQLQYLLLRPYFTLPLVIHYLVNQHWPFGSSIDYRGGEAQFLFDLYDQFERLNLFLDIFILAGTVIHLLDFATAWSKVYFRIAFKKLPFSLCVKRLPSDMKLAELLFHLVVCTVYFSGLRKHSWQTLWNLTLWAPVLIISLIHRHEITNSFPLVYHHAQLWYQGRLPNASSPQGPKELRKIDVQQSIELPLEYGPLADTSDLELLAFLYETNAPASTSTELSKGIQFLLDNSDSFLGSGLRGRVLASAFASLSRHESVGGEPEVLRTDLVRPRQFSEEAFGFLLRFLRGGYLSIVRQDGAIRTLEDAAVESTNEYNRQIGWISELRSELAKMKDLKERAQAQVSRQEKEIKDKNVEIADLESRYNKEIKDKDVEIANWKLRYCKEIKDKHHFVEACSGL